MQNYRDNLSARVALEVELRVNNLEKELVLSARVHLEGGLSGDLCFEMIALKCEIDYGTGIELIFANVIAERGNIEFDFLRLGRKLGCAQFRGRMVASVKLMAIPTILSKNSSRADGKMGIALCPVAWAKSPSFMRTTFRRNFSASL
jgi:hypothetical protein